MNLNSQIYVVTIVFSMLEIYFGLKTFLQTGPGLAPDKYDKLVAQHKSTFQ